MQLEVLVEEPSAEATLRVLLPRILAGIDSAPVWQIRTFSGKQALLRELPRRLQGYRSYADAADLRILVLIDRDADDCLVLKGTLDRAAASVGLRTRSVAGEEAFRVCNRIAVEELEAWFIGDPEAVVSAYPRVPAGFGARRTLRHPDGVRGGTWEALGRLLKRHGYHSQGLAKVRLAQDVAPYMEPSRNGSPSFRTFCTGVAELVSQ